MEIKTELNLFLRKNISNFAPMKRFIISIILISSVITMMAVPALRGQWRTITLGDGSQVKVEAVGAT